MDKIFHAGYSILKLENRINIVTKKALIRPKDKCFFYELLQLKCFIMSLTAKRITAYLLSSLIIVCTSIALLAIWDVIDLQDVMRKILTSLLVIFASSVVTLFIFNVVLKETN